MGEGGGVMVVEELGLFGGWGGGGGGIEFAKSGRTMDRKPGRKEDESLPVKCHCLRDGT